MTATDPHRAVVDGIALTIYPARATGATATTPVRADAPDTFRGGPPGSVASERPGGRSGGGGPDGDARGAPGAARATGMADPSAEAAADAAGAPGATAAASVPPAMAHAPDRASTAGGRGAAVAIVWPAMGTPARFYRLFAEELRAAGLTAVLADLRGTGESGPPPTRASRWGYGQLAADVGTVLAAVRRSYPGRTTVLVGHSLGGQAALLHLAAEPDAAVDGLVLVAVGLPYWRSYRRGGAAVLAYTQGINAVSTVLRIWPGWRFGGRQARGVISDWAATARTGRYRVDVEAALPTVTTPVLAISFDGDRYTPHGTLDHLLAKMPAAPVARERMRPPVADGRPVHFAWARESGTVVARIASFVAALPAVQR